MTKLAWVSRSYFDTDSDFRAWGSGISVALANLGLIQTADTGQINWTTASKPSGSSTYPGYEIWRFNDSLQGTYPLYFKIEYGASANGAAYASIRITVGKGSSGSGAITTAFGTTFLSGYAGQSAALFAFAAGHSGGFALHCGPASTTTVPGFAIERSLNSSGSPVGDGFLLALGASGVSIGNQWYVYNYGTPATYAATQSPVLLPTTYTTAAFAASSLLSSDGESVVVYPVVLFCLGVTPWTSKLFSAIAPGDAAVNSSFRVNLYGAQHTFRGFPVVGLGGFPILPGGTVTTATPAAMLWE